MQKLFLTLVMFSISFSANARPCEAVHRTPEFLYLSLKAEEWRYHPIPLREVPRYLPLPESLREKLIEDHSEKFNVRDLSPEDLSRFYVNWLRSQYVQAANQLKAQELRHLAGGRQIEFSTVLLEQLISYKNLNDRELSPAVATELLRLKQWRQFPWTRALDLVEAFEAHGVPFSRNNFLSWAEAQSHGLSSREIDVIVHALDRSRSKRSPLCCLANPGCHDCPTNRRWRR